MEVFENNETQKSDMVDFSSICRICLKRSDSRLFKVEACLLELYLTITKINVRSAANLPKNICNDCIKTLEEISFFIVTENNEAKWRKNQKHIKSEEYGEDLQYFEEFEICRICYSTNILKPVEEKAHLIQLFQNITNIVVESEVPFSNRNIVCNKCINKLETISLFISVSLSNEMKLKNTIGRNEALKIENCLEGNAIEMGYPNIVKNNDDFDKNAHSCEGKILHTFVDIKEEIVDTPEASTGQINRNGIYIFSESNSEENPFDRVPCKDEIQSGTNRFKCDSCNESFTMKQSLKTHILTHTKKIEKPFKCDICEKNFSRKSCLQTHLSSHSNERQFKCDSCEKTFNRKSCLQTHLTSHSKERPFKCDCCEKSFTLKSNLQKHVFLHSGKRPFKCGYCKKSFSLKGTLQQHVFIHTGERKFKCGCCEKSFAKKSTLQEHMFIHSGEKPFKCGCCGKCFTHRGNLYQHMIVHSGEKPFKCDWCEKSFTKKSNLQQHMIIIHTGEKLFNCDYCKKTFLRKWSLKKHLLSHTTERSFID